MTAPPAPLSLGPGNPTTRATVDMTSGTLAQQIQIWCLNVATFNTWLAAQTEEVLAAPPFSYTEEDIALLKSATTDELTLSQIFLGEAELTPARDLSVFVKQLAGVRLVM